MKSVVAYMEWLLIILYICLGPIGVGRKTLARAVALALYYSEQSIYTIGMSKYTEANSIYKLINIPRGKDMVDPEQNKLIKIIQQKPYTIILFDQIEKVHHEFWNILLAYLDNDNVPILMARFDDSPSSSFFRHISLLKTYVNEQILNPLLDCLSLMKHISNTKFVIDIHDENEYQVQFG
ncbi:unnamed protein product [Rotaria sp. Silwood2]|nr:unnamed protein product [Rotaria sp. Silwood2]